MTYGHEHAERITVTVTTEHRGIPAGKVTIKNRKSTVCTITLARGKGSCKLTARQFRAGTYTLVATYSGSTKFTSSASTKKKLTVAR